MADNTPIASLYAPTLDESARQRFAGSLKAHVNGPLEARLADLYEREIAPAFRARTGRPPRDRYDVLEDFDAEPLYQSWGSMTYTSQDLMWETVGDTVDRVRPAFEARARALSDKPKLGSLALDPDLEIPEPIASIPIHRQPGGYFYEAGPEDLTTGLLYFGTLELYRSAKGLGTGAKTGEPGMGRMIAAQVRERYPDLKPRRILDLGCGIGTDTHAWHEAFPEAELHGVDLSGPMLRFGHLWAEDKGVAIHFRQASAHATGLPDGHFDLIVSHILFHETWFDLVPAIMAEANRLLAPGGVLLNADVPYQPDHIPITKQVTNHWQVKNNGEPFWVGFAETDVRETMIRAGFAPERVHADYVPLGRGDYFFFGARKTPAH